MINEPESEFAFHSQAFDQMVERLPEGRNKQAATTLLEFVAKLRLLVSKPDYEEKYSHWFGQVRECLSGRDCEEIMVKRLGELVEQFKIPHQFVFDFIKGIEREAQTKSFRDFAALETCAYLNSSAILICLAKILADEKNPEDESLDEEVRTALIELGLADYLLHKMANFVPQLESKIYFFADQEVQDRGLDLRDLTEPIDDGLWKDLIQFQCKRLLLKLQSVKVLTSLPRGKLKKSLNWLAIQNLTMLKKIRRLPSTNLRSRVDLSWGEKMRAKLTHWRSFQIPTV